MLVIGRSYWVEPIQEEVEEKEADLTEGGTTKLTDETIENSVEGTDPTKTADASTGEA